MYTLARLCVSARPLLVWSSSGAHAMSLEGKTAVITGGASGIGFATAEEFLRGGVSVKV